MAGSIKLLENYFEEIKNLIDEGKSYSYISKIYNVSSDSVRLFSIKHNLRKKRENFSITKEELEKYLLVDKKSFKEVGNLFGICENVIRKWCKKLGLYDRYLNKEYIGTSNNLPMPLKYSYPLFMTINLPGRKNSLTYIPELDKFISSINLNKELRNNNIVPEYWKLRWIDKLPSTEFTTDNWIELIIRKFYNNKPFKTKGYIKYRLRQNPNYVCDFFILSDDLVDLYYQSRRNIGREIYNYDFSLIPKYIRYRETKFCINVLEIDPNTNDYIGLWYTDYNHFIEANYDKEMLWTGMYPEYLKRRVSGGNGHLSNDLCAQAIIDNASEKLRHVWLCHLSGENNHPELARKTVELALKNSGKHYFETLPVDVLKRNVPSDVYEL